jgi:transcriptional regulator with XRE-family HTH domain
MSSFTKWEEIVAGSFGYFLVMATRYISIGNRLAAARDALGNISQADVCRAIKVKPPRWSQYESGERRITIDVAIKFADEYGFTLDWIYRNSRVGLPQHLHHEISKRAA